MTLKPLFRSNGLLSADDLAIGVLNDQVAIGTIKLEDWIRNDLSALKQISLGLSDLSEFQLAVAGRHLVVLTPHNTVIIDLLNDATNAGSAWSLSAPLPYSPPLLCRPGAEYDLVVAAKRSVRGVWIPPWIDSEPLNSFNIDLPPDSWHPPVQLDDHRLVFVSESGAAACAHLDWSERKVGDIEHVSWSEDGRSWGPPIVAEDGRLVLEAWTIHEATTCLRQLVIRGWDSSEQAIVTLRTVDAANDSRKQTVRPPVDAGSGRFVITNGGRIEIVSPDDPKARSEAERPWDVPLLRIGEVVPLIDADLAWTPPAIPQGFHDIHLPKLKLLHPDSRLVRTVPFGRSLVIQAEDPGGNLQCCVVPCP